MGISALHPGLLIAGLACIVIPILIHLLRRKHRPVSWGAMRFLEQAYKKRKRLITIEQLLLLLARCAIVALIAGGVGALIIGSGISDQQARTLILVLDNSIHSASRLDNGESSLQYQQRRALELLNTLDSGRGDQAALVTIAGPAQGVAVPATTELGLISSRIQSLGPTDADRDLQGALALVNQVIETSQEGSIVTPAFVFAAEGWNTDSESSDRSLKAGSSLTQAVLLDIPEQTRSTNVALIDASALRPIVTRSTDLASQIDEIHGIRVSLQRTGDPNAELSTTLIVTDATSDTILRTETIDWPTGQSSVTRNLTLDPGQLKIARGGSAFVRIDAQSPQGDSNPRDNMRVVGLPLRQQIRIGIIDTYTTPSDGSIRPSRWLRAVLGADQGLITIQQINASAAADRIDPTLDLLFILTPSAIDDRGWARIARLNARSSGSIPIVITPDASKGTLDWIAQLNPLAPGLIDGLRRGETDDLNGGVIQIRSYDPPIGLSNTPESAGLLSGINNEYAELASSVTLSRSLVLNPGVNASVLLNNSDSEPIALSSVERNQQSGSSLENSLGSPLGSPPGSPPRSIVVLGFALDARWTDLPARPLFVAMMHEMTRSLLSRSIAPNNRLTGLSSASIDLESLEPLLQDSPLPNPRLKGAYAVVDEQGTTQRTLILNPDASNTALDPSRLSSASARLETLIEGIEINDISQQADLSIASQTGASQSGRPIALLLFGLAMIVGVIELLLARRCSYSAVSPITQAGGAR